MTDRQPTSTGHRVNRSAAFPIRRLQAGDAEFLAAFYNNLNAASKRTFHPLGEQTTLHECRKIIEDNKPGIARKLDLVATQGPEIIGWCHLRDLDSPEPTLGLAVADEYHGQRLGTKLMAALMDEARIQSVKTVKLIVVQDNKVAQRLYEKFGFEKTGEFESTEDGLPYWRMVAHVNDVGPAMVREPVPATAGKQAIGTSR
jgi:RimJ/RimL family protein N-acetyltransferase